MLFDCYELCCLKRELTLFAKESYLKLSLDVLDNTCCYLHQHKQPQHWSCDLSADEIPMKLSERQMEMRSKRIF